MDDGWSGTTFARPAFTEIMGLAEKGMIGTLIVKDHSLLGRNRLVVGKNDNGEVVGLSDKDRKKLLESIPNKITATMGIVADVNLLYDGNLQYIEIIVDRYPSLISYHGKYFYRSRSTMRTITGKELNKAILKSQGITWDGMRSQNYRFVKKLKFFASKLHAHTLYR